MSKKTKTLILFIDALRYDYVAKMPYLSQMAKKSVSGNLKPGFAYFASPAAFFTGQTPEKTNYLTHFYCTPRSRFRWLKPFIKLSQPLSKISFFAKPISLFWLLVMNGISFLQGNRYLFSPRGLPLDCLWKIDTVVRKNYGQTDVFPVPSLTDHLTKNNWRYLYYFWPFTNRSSRVSFELPLKNNDQHRFERFFQSLTQRFDLWFVHLWSLDTMGHRYLSDSAKKKAALLAIDKKIKKMVEKFKKLYPEGQVLIWTDHGMTPIKKILDVEKILVKTKARPFVDYDYFLDSTLARFWFHSPEAKKEVLARLAKTDLIEIDEVKKKKYGWRFVDNLYGETIFVVPAGTLLFPNFWNRNSPEKGMHGFLPETRTEQGFYLYQKDGVKEINKNLEMKSLHKFLLERL